MSDPTFIACPHCGEPVVMSEMQLELFRGRALACAKCAKQFTVDPRRTPLFRLSPGGRAYLSSPPPEQAEPQAAPAPSAQDVQASAAPSAAPSDPTPPSFSSRGKPRRNQGEARWQLPAYFAAGVALVALILAVIVLPPMTSAGAAQRQLNCASNLRQLSIALQVYAAGNNGQFPDTLASLVSSNLLRPDALICPAASSAKTASLPPTVTPATVLSSYNYLGKGMTTAAASNPQTVIAYEPLENHGASKGMHVLYANGSVAFVAPPLSQQTVRALSVPGATTAPSAATSDGQ